MRYKKRYEMRYIKRYEERYKKRYEMRYTKRYEKRYKMCYKERIKKRYTCTCCTLKYDAPNLTDTAPAVVTSGYNIPET